MIKILHAVQDQCFVMIIHQGLYTNLSLFVQNKVLSSHHSYMIHKLISHWNQRPSAFLQNPYAFDLKLNKGAIIRRHLAFFSNPDFTQLQFKFTNGAQPTQALFERSMMVVKRGIPREHVLFFDFLLICPVKSSPILSYAKVSPVSPPLSSPAWWRTVQVYRWEELPEKSLRLFSLQKTGKWKQMADGWKYTTLKNFLPWPIPCLLQSLLW